MKVYNLGLDAVRILALKNIEKCRGQALLAKSSIALESALDLR